MNQKFLFSLLTVLVLLLLITSSVTAQYPGYSWVTNYAIVNIGTGLADITIRYYNSSGVEVVAAQRQYLDVPIGGSRKVIQMIDDPNLGGGSFSVVIDTNQPLATTVGQQLVPTGSVTYNPVPPFSSYSGASSGTFNVTLPSVLYNWFDYYTEFFVMNTGAAGATNVDISYVPGKLSGCNTGATGVTDLNLSIPRYASIPKSQLSLSSLGAPAVGGCPSYLTGRFNGTAIITSDQPIVAIVNIHNPTTFKLGTYNGFNAGDTSILVPQYMRGYFGYYANIGITNPDPSLTANVQIKYTPTGPYNLVSSGVVGPVTANYSILPRETLVRYDGPTASDEQSDLDDNPVYVRFFGNVKITSNIPVMVLGNVESSAIVGSYNALNVSQATPQIGVPDIVADYYGYYTTLGIQNATSTASSCDITYTSDGVYSLVKNQSRTYTHPLPANESITVYEGHSGGISTGDINNDPFWGPPLGRRFLGSANIVCGQNVVAFINLQSDTPPGKDTVYTYTGFNK